MVEAQVSIELESYEKLQKLIEAGDADAIEAFWRSLPSRDLARAVSRLSSDEHRQLLTMLDPDDAADLVDDLSVAQAMDLLEELEVSEAAAIFDELDSDDQVDILAAFDDEDAEAIIEQMSPEEVRDVRQLSMYAPDSAGGLMRTEYLAYSQGQTVADVLKDLRERVEETEEIDVQYLYVLGPGGILRGCVRLRDLVLSPGNRAVIDLVHDEAKSINVDADLDEIDDFFDAYPFFAAPIIDANGKMVGVLRRAMAEEAMGERADKMMMQAGGIISGEELRTMPMHLRTLRRLAFLVPSLFLSLLAVSAIAIFESTIDDVPALAIFLPLVAGLCGAAGHQAMAVSMREITLGITTSADVFYVVIKELGVGMLLGIAMGILVFFVTWAMKSDLNLAICVGAAIPVTILVAAAVGGIIPLVLKAIKLDPAMASGPLLTTIVDLTGFFAVLGAAAFLFR